MSLFATYFTSSVVGASDLLDALSCGSRYVYYFSRNNRAQEVASRVADAFSSGRNALYFVNALTSVQQWGSGAQELCSRHFEKIYIKNFFYQSAGVVANVAESAKYIYTAVGKVVPAPLRGAASFAWLVTDLTDFVDEMQEIAENEQKPRTSQLDEEKRFIELKLVKIISSIALDVLGVLALLFVSVGGSAATPALFLGLSTTYLVLNVSVYLFGKNLEKKYAPAHSF